MSVDWEQSRAAARLRAAGELQAGAPPPLATVREVAGRKARRAAQLLAFAVAIPLGAMAAGGAYVWKSQPREAAQPRSGVPAPLPLKARAPLPLVAPEPAPAPLPMPEPAAETPAPAPAAVARPVARAPVAAPSTPEIPAVAGHAPPPPPPARTSLADESLALSQALSALRGQHDAAKALELLAAYRERFPGGALRHEAALATVEAHRALGHTGEAVTQLEALPRRPELDVLRAELYAELGRCEETRALLTGQSFGGALEERALFTDATCALTLGARDEAISDLERLPASARAKALLEKLR